MNEDEMLAVVRAERLERAWETFPDDVRTAFNLAAQQAQGLRAVLPATVEPWPPMRKGNAA